MRNIVRRTAALLLIIGMLLSLVGCGEEKDATSVVKSMFFSYYMLNPKEAEANINFEEANITVKENKALDESELYLKYLLQRVKYQIVSATKTDDDTVIVKVNIKAVNMRPIVSELLRNVSQYKYLYKLRSADQMTDEDKEKIEEIFKEIALRTELITITREIDVKVVKTDDKWIIMADRNLVNTLYGDFLELIKENGVS